MAPSRTKVVLRVRPTEPFPTEQFQILPDNRTVTLCYGGTSSSGLPSDKAGHPQQYTFKFDSVLHQASQQEVFEACASDAVASVLDGVNATVMCYGQTGAGKTYTMSGDRRQFASRGLIPRAISAVLAGLRSRPGLRCWRLAVSYLEVYNEALYDLLALSTCPSELGLYEDAATGATQVAGLRLVPVSNEAEALGLFFEGESNRVIGAHQLNRDSSRSHTLFSLHLALTQEGGDGAELVSRLVLVDLAGSERVSKTCSEGATALREAGAINRSLHVLEQVVGAAAKRRRPDHVPYRSSRLTHVLRDSLGGNARTLLVANVWGDAGQLGESLSTCRFAARMARLSPDVTRNVTRGGGGEAGPRVRALEREVAELKEELAMSDLMAAFSQQQQQDGQGSNNDAVAVAAAAAADARQPYSEAQRAQLRHRVLTWLTCEDGAGSSQPGCLLAPLPLTNTRQLRELLLTYKAIVKQCVHQQQQQQHQQQHSAGSGSSSSSRTVAGPHQASRRPTAAAGGLPASPTPAWHGGSGGVGDGEQHCSSSAAPDDARPPGYGGGGDEAAAASERPRTSAAAALPASGQQDAPCSSVSGCRPPLFGAQQRSGGEASTSSAGGASAERDAALAGYLAGPGAPHASLLNANASKLRAARHRARELGGRLNELVGALEGLKARQGRLQQQRLAGGPAVAEVLGAEEFAVLQEIRDTKAAYRDAAAELALARDEAAYSQSLRDACAAQLEAHFQAWAQAQQQQAVPSARAGASSITSGSTSGSRASSASSTAASQLAPAPGSGGGRRCTRTPPLASLLGGLGSDAGSDGCEAAAYAAALEAASSSGGGGARTSVLKQHRHERGTFSLAGRSQINDVL